MLVLEIFHLVITVQSVTRQHACVVSLESEQLFIAQGTQHPGALAQTNTQTVCH